MAYSHVVDLSHVITPDIPLWPGDPPVVFTDVATFLNDGYFLRMFQIGEHSATHMNAANSFIDGNTRAITSYSARQRVVKAVVIDVRAKCAADADYQLSLRDVRHWEARHGKIAKGSFVIMFTGWQAKWRDPAAFINQDAEGNLHFPGFAAATTDWLVKARNLRRRHRHPRRRPRPRHELRDQHRDGPDAQDRHRVHGQPRQAASQGSHAGPRAAAAAGRLRLTHGHHRSGAVNESLMAAGRRS